MTDQLSIAFGRFCLTYRKTVLFIIAAITVLAASQLPKARFDNALEIWFLDDDPTLLGHQKLLDTYGSDELIMIGLEAPDVFAPDVLAVIDRVTRGVKNAPHVEKVFSLTDIESITGDDGMLEVGKLIEMPVDPAELPAIRERALANTLYLGNIVSADGTFACIVARLPHRTDDFQYKLEAITAIREIMAAEQGTRFYFAGGPVLDEQFFVLSEADSRLTMSLMIGLLAVILWLLLRSIRGVIIPLVTVVIAVVWAVGWMVLAGAPVNIITTMLPPLLLAVGIADSMHVLVDYQNRCRDGQDKMDALHHVYRELTMPCFLTSLTTCVGMLSLLVSKLQGIREFGIFGALGVFGAFLLSVTFVPVVLSYLPPPKPVAEDKESRWGLSARTLRGLHAFTMRRGPAIIGVSVAVLAVSIAGATRVESESAFMEYFRKDEPIRVETQYMEDALSGTMTMEVMFNTGRDDGVKDPAFLQYLAGFQAFLTAQPEVGSAQAVTDYFKDLRRAFFDNDQRQYRLPETAEEAAQYLLLYEMDAPDGDIQEFVTMDYREARVSARLTITTSRAASDVVKRAEAYLAQHEPPGVTHEIAGLAFMYMNMEDYIRLSLIRSFSLAIVLIFVVFCLQMRSVLLGAIAMIPNIAPIIVCLGIMGFSGILLDSMTAMVASVAIGLAVDDSIHFVSRVRRRLDEGHDMRIALRSATVEVGRALVYTSVTLCGGFSIMMVAHFMGMVYFGMLCSITIVIALTADLLLLPVVLRWYGRRREPTAAAAAPVLAPATEA